MNLQLHLFFLVATISSNLFMDRIAVNAEACTLCLGDECDTTREPCEFGTVRDICGRLECRRALNQTCGGLNGSRGVCAQGLFCKCNRCQGCLYGQCYETECHEEQSRMNPNYYAPIFNKLPRF